MYEALPVFARRVACGCSRALGSQRWDGPGKCSAARKRLPCRPSGGGPLDPRAALRSVEPLRFAPEHGLRADGFPQGSTGSATLRACGKGAKDPAGRTPARSGDAESLFWPLKQAWRAARMRTSRTARASPAPSTASAAIPRGVVTFTGRLRSDPVDRGSVAPAILRPERSPGAAGATGQDPRA